MWRVRFLRQKGGCAGDYDDTYRTRAFSVALGPLGSYSVRPEPNLHGEKVPL
jgi:hypothetical protein